MAVLAETPRPGRAAAGDFSDTLRTIAAALLIALLLRTVLFQPYTIPSSSMEPGLVTGDYIVVSKFSYGWSRASLPLNPILPAGRLLFTSPARGDVVVFRLPRDPNVTYIKRVIGLPGDRIVVRAGHVAVNGRAIPRAWIGQAQDHDDPLRTVEVFSERAGGRASYVTYNATPGHAGGETAAYLVPAGAYFVMGDNRDNSLDSRWPPEVGVGFVPADNLIGKAQFVLLSWRPGASMLKPWTWLNLQPGRFLRPIV
jgi:signal peptidase I